VQGVSGQSCSKKLRIFNSLRENSTISRKRGESEGIEGFGEPLPKEVYIFFRRGLSNE